MLKRPPPPIEILTLGILMIHVRISTLNFRCFKYVHLDSFKVSWRHNRSLCTYGLIFISFISSVLLCFMEVNFPDINFLLLHTFYERKRAKKPPKWPFSDQISVFEHTQKVKNFIFSQFLKKLGCLETFMKISALYDIPILKKALIKTQGLYAKMTNFAHFTMFSIIADFDTNVTFSYHVLKHFLLRFSFKCFKIKVLVLDKLCYSNSDVKKTPPPHRNTHFGDFNDTCQNFNFKF